MLDIGNSSVHLAHLLVLVLSAFLLLLLIKNSLSVFVQLECGNDTVAGVDWNLGLLAVELLPHDFLNVNASASAVDGLDFAFTSLEVTSHNLDLIALTHWDGADLVLIVKVF